MRRLLLSFVIFLISMTAFAQLEVKIGSFKEVPGFVNINPDQNYQTDDNDLPFAVIKVRTENINDKQRRELTFRGNAGTFIVLEYKDGEVWVYLTAKYADYLKISHPDFSSIEFTLPYDLEPKKGYEMTLVNKPAVDEEIQKKLERLEELEKAGIEPKQKTVITYKTKSLNGKFSVSPNKLVVFAQGNLQYNASAETWRFAENQWDCLVDDNENISNNYNGWIDLFGWGTGKNPTKTSENNSGYSTFNDWGNNKISNGGGKRWRTLTNTEWVYILNKRKTPSGVRFAKAIVNGVNGLILLPDNWNNNIYSLNKPNSRGAGYGKNTISQDDWIRLFESNGAVFLPAAGYRNGRTVDYIGFGGLYWSASSNSNNDAQSLFFYDGLAGMGADGWRYRKDGLSVRLVSDVE